MQSRGALETDALSLLLSGMKSAREVKQTKTIRHPTFHWLYQLQKYGMVWDRLLFCCYS
jgi:hypothetical protein